MVLEMLLCQLEEPANIATKLKEVERMLENKEKSEGQVSKINSKGESKSKARVLLSLDNFLLSQKNDLEVLSTDEVFSKEIENERTNSHKIRLKNIEGHTKTMLTKGGR